MATNLPETSAKLATTYTLPPRDSSGRFVKKPAPQSGDPTENQPNQSQPADSRSLTTTRPPSSLSNFEEINYSQAATPFVTTPAPSPIKTSYPPLPSDQTDCSPPPTTAMSTEHITPFEGDNDKESPEDFLRSFFRKMGSASDETKRLQFPNYLQADSVADTWYEELPPKDKKDWSSIEAAFRQRWPRKKAIKKTMEEYEEEITLLKLRMEDLGKKEKLAGRDIYTHIVWADKMAAIIKGAKLEETTTYIASVRKDLPKLLREKLGAGHKDWTTFLEAVRDIDIDYIRDGVDIWKKEEAKQQAFTQRLRELEIRAQSSPLTQIQQQMSTLSISAPPVARSSSLPNPVLPTVPTNNPSYTTPSGAQGRPTYPNSRSTNPQTRPPSTPAEKDTLRTMLQRYPQQPDTEEGRRAHQAQQANWVTTYGVRTRVTDSTPYPLRPGTAPVNSGECFTCGFTGHYGQRGVDASVTCGGRRALHPNESHWRRICANVLKEPRNQTPAGVNLVAIDDYGTMMGADDQGNGEGSST